MSEKVVKHWNITSPINAVFLAFLVLAAASAIGLSVIDLFGFPLLFNDAATIQEMESLPPSPLFSIALTNTSLAGQTLQMDNSPYDLNLTINTPPLTREHEISVAVVSGGKILSKTSCPEEDETNSHLGLTQVTCIIPLTYGYITQEDLKIYAVIEDNNAGVKNSAAPLQLKLNWANYEGFFWSSAGLVLILALLGLGACGLLALVMFFFATRIKHETEYAGEYSLTNVFLPFKNIKSIGQGFQAYLASPLFWALEVIGILVILIYLAIASEPWKSASALFAFFISGALAFITPFFWVALMWFADYKEREPLRIIASMFLWGGFACLMAIGFNSIGSLFFLVCGLGFVAASFTAPLCEEWFKGTGLAIFSFHHEYDDMVDGIVYGFAIGMGFSFVEDWLYLLNNPMGGDVGGWFFVFILRSIFFSANHGVFTAITGGIIGLLKQWKFPYATLALIVAILPGMIIHSIHNSGAIWSTFLGVPGFCTYCCILIPLFDYGGLILVALFLIGGVIFTHVTRGEEPKPPPPAAKEALPAPKKAKKEKTK